MLTLNCWPVHHIVYTPQNISDYAGRGQPANWDIVHYTHICYSISQEICTRFLLCCGFVVVIHWLIFPYPSGLLHWHCGNLTIAPVPAKQPWWIWINTSCEFIMNDCITTTKQSTTKPCAYFLGYTVPHKHRGLWCIVERFTYGVVRACMYMYNHFNYNCGKVYYLDFLTLIGQISMPGAFLYPESFQIRKFHLIGGSNWKAKSKGVIFINQHIITHWPLKNAVLISIF